MRTRPVLSRRCSHLALLALAGTCASAHASLFTFTPTCAPFNWNSQCSGAACGGGQFLQTNNFGLSSCGGTPLLPGAGDDVVFAGNGTINAGTGVLSITINPGVSVTQATSIGTGALYQNNGAVQTGPGSLTYSGTINNAGTWVEDGAAWGRALNSCSFTNTGAFQLPGSVSINNNAGTNAFQNTGSGSLTKSGGGTATLNGFNFVNSAGIVGAAGGGAINFSSMAFVSQAGAAYTANAGSSINFTNGTVRGPFPMTLAADNLATFTSVSLAAPTTVNASPGAALFTGNITGSGTNTLTNSGRVNTAPASASWTGAFTNSVGAAWTEDGAGWGRALNSHSFTNAGTLNFPGSVIWQSNAGVNTFTNTGTVVKSGGGTMQMVNYARTNSGAMNVLANGGTLQFNNSPFASDPGATYSVTGPNSAIFWNGASIAGGFPISLSAGGAASFTSPTTNAPTTINATGGAAVLNGGNLNTSAGLLTNTGQLAIGPGTHNWTGPWTNAPAGIVTEDGAGWGRNLNSCTVTNQGTINFPGGVIWANNSGTNAVVNSGTMNKTTGAQFLSANLSTFTNNGTITIAASGGNFQVSSSTFSGTGTISVGAAGGMQINDCTVTSGVTGSNSGGTFQTTGTLTVPASTTTDLNVTGGGFSINGNLSVSGSGLLRNIANVNVGGGIRTFSGPVTNAAGATWTEDGAGWSRTLNSHAFTNQGTLNLPNSVVWTNNAGTNSLTNTGTINKTGGGSFTATNLASVTNNGLLNIASGGGSFVVTSTTYSGSGNVATATGGNMQLSDCTITGTVNGSNTGGTFQSTGALTAGTGAALNVTGSGFSLNGNKAGGLLTNTGIVGVNAGDKVFAGPVTNASGATWTEDASGWNRTLNSYVFTNSGTLNLPNTVTWTNNAGTNRLDNLAGGVVNKTAGGTFTTTMNGGVVNAGLIDIQTGTFNAGGGGLTQPASTGKVLVRSGAALSGTPFTMANGRLEGRGTVNQNFTNSGGTVAPGGDGANGTLNFSGTFTQAAGGTYEVNLNANVGALPNDRVLSNGNMTLGGTLRVVIDSPYYPTLADVYEIARTNGTRSGVFSSVVVVGPPEVTVSVSYTGTTALLTITGTTCDQIDFNNDGLFPDTADIDDFLSRFSGGPCSTDPAPGCNDIDFNNDGLYPDTLDIDSLLSVFSGGPCL